MSEELQHPIPYSALGYQTPLEAEIEYYYENGQENMLIGFTHISPL